MTVDPTEAELNEANGKRYGRDVVMVLRLSTGRLAVLGTLHKLLGIVETLDEAQELSRSDFQQYVLPPLGQKILKTDKTAEDLGL